MSSFLVYGIVELQTDVEQPPQQIGQNADFIFLDTVPSGVNVYVILENRYNRPILLNTIRAIRNPRGRWRAVWAYTKGTAPGGVARIYVGGESTIEFANIAQDVIISPLDAGGRVLVAIGADAAGLAKDLTLQRFIPILKGQLFNTSYTANTNFFSTALTPTNPPCTFRIYVAMSVAGVLTVTRTVGATTVSEALNQGANLAANAAYIFDIPVDANESINLQYNATGTILKCSVREIDMVSA